MSRLSLPSKPSAKLASLGQHATKQRSVPVPATTARGGGDAAPTATARPSQGADGWWDWSDEEEDPKHFATTPVGSKRKQEAVPRAAGKPATSRQQGAAPEATASQLALFSTPRSEVYDVWDSDSGAENEQAHSGRARGPAAAAARCSSQPLPLATGRGAGAALAACPICGDTWVGLSPEQQQQHANACCDAAARGACTVRRQASQDAIPAYRPSQQQQQQQQQQSLPQQQHKATCSHQQQQPKGAAGQPRRAAAQREVRERQHCSVCGADVNHLSNQHQAKHVKACMAGRPTRLAQQQQQPGSEPVQAAQAQLPQAPPRGWSAPGSAARAPLVAAHEPADQGRQPSAASLRDMSIREWLEGLGLGCYAATFEGEEVEVGVAHLVSAEELAGIGVTDREHQKRILQAAEGVAAALGLRRPRRGISVSAAFKAGRPAAAKKQRHLTELLPLGAGGRTTAAPAAGPANTQQRAQPSSSSQRWSEQKLLVLPGGLPNSWREAGPRPQERALLNSLYPPQAPAARARGPGLAVPRRTPQLPAGRTSSRATPTDASLWAGAGACSPRAPTLVARLAQREAERPEEPACGPQQLARGGTAYPVAQESRALKALQLEALRQELRQQEATCAQVRSMVAKLEREVHGGAGVEP